VQKKQNRRRYGGFAVSALILKEQILETAVATAVFVSFPREDQ
jgi:hypothetical protein